MKFENLVLRCLFLACVVVCGLILAAMVTTEPATAVQLAANSRVSAILLAAPSTCALPPDGVICPRNGG